MRLFVKTFEAQTLSVEAESDQLMSELICEVAERLSLPAHDLRISGHDPSATILDSGLRNGCTVHLQATLRGGGNREWMDLKLKELAFHHNVDKKVCRKCYARLPPRATNCRKKHCRSSDLRKKGNNPNK